MHIHARASEILQSVAAQYRQVLGDNLTGIYVHGSLAFECFHWNRSDIDFIVVVQRKLDRETKKRLLGILEGLRPQCPPKGLEMSVVLKKHCRKFIYPTPYELHFSPSWLARYLADPYSLCGEEPKTDRDLAAHFTVIRHTGIALTGSPIDAVFGEVNSQYFLDSLWADVRDAEGDLVTAPVSVILNLCRTLAYIREGLVLSKGQGGRWALKCLEEPFRSVAKEAERCYTLGGTLGASPDQLVAFRRYLLGKMEGESKRDHTAEY